MTSNLPIEQINTILDVANRKDNHIRITSNISQSIDFLDVHIENKNGELNTSVYYKSMAEPYIFRYTSDHPRHIHRNMPYVGLLRAARLCSHANDFDAERLNMEMVLLLNGYPPKFISHHIKSFFIRFNAMSVWTELDTGSYHILHPQLLHKLTLREQQLQNSSHPTETSLCSRQYREYKNHLLIHRTFETGPLLNFKLQYRQLWNKSYVTSAAGIGKARLIIGNTNNPSLQSLFVWKKPSREMLTRMECEETVSTANRHCSKTCLNRLPGI